MSKRGGEAAGLGRCVNVFIRVVGRYWQHNQLYELALAPHGVEAWNSAGSGNAFWSLVEGDPTVLKEACRHQTNLFSARKAVLKIGRILARELEGADHDSRPLLAFLHAVDRAGGPPAAGPLWGGIKCDLERIAIRYELAPELHVFREPETDDVPMSSGRKSAKELADDHGLPYDRLRARLKRWRHNNGEGWIEISQSERGPRDPHFLYEVVAVRPVIDQLRAALAK